MTRHIEINEWGLFITPGEWDNQCLKGKKPIGHNFRLIKTKKIKVMECTRCLILCVDLRKVIQI